MTPDMKRLCKAAERAMPVQFNGHGDFREGGKGPIAEAIVRAVLMALREPSRAMKDAASYVEVEGDYPQSFTLRPKQAAEAFTAMIDHILDTNARRAVALQDLADIDRDLL